MSNGLICDSGTLFPLCLSTSTCGRNPTTNRKRFVVATKARIFTKDINAQAEAKPAPAYPVDFVCVYFLGPLLAGVFFGGAFFLPARSVDFGILLGFWGAGSTS